MNKEDYKKYYQTGGSYVIPVEIFNELFEDYEFFKNDCKKYKEVFNKVREYIWRTEINSIGTPLACITIGKELLDIIKEVENERTS